MGATGFETTVLLIAFLLFFGVMRSSWQGKTSATLALVIFCIVLVAAVTLHIHLNFYDGMTRYRSVIELLIGIALIRIVFMRAVLERPLRSLLSSVKPSWRSLVLTTIVCLLALPLSLATIAIVTSLLKDIIRPRHATSVVTMRAVCATMFLIPTTVGSAAVSVSLPSLDTVDLMFKGIPLFAIAFVGCCFQKMEVDLPKATEKNHIQAKSIAVIIAFWSFLSFFTLVLHSNPIQALTLSGILLFLFDSFWFNKRNVMTVLSEVRASIGNTSPEMMLLLACGFLSVLLSQVTLPDIVVSILQRISFNPALSVALIVFVLPAISILGIHPLILFNVSFPLIDSSLFGSTSNQYLVWVTMFITAQLVSPVSISALMAANSLSLSPSKTSFKIHTRYALFLSACVWAYVLLTR
ncbi:hypothetical protein N0Y54_36480 [Nostoc punctiforme UO1]|uniref:hypothetical protein n=1 Tax=Nostoc punctiforme TaxID=272131 RepID=UPI0030A28133